MLTSHKIILTLIAVCSLCVIVSSAGPVTALWYEDIEVSQTHAVQLHGSYPGGATANSRTDIWFTITYDNTIVEISSFVFTDDPDHSRSASIERLANNKIQVKVSGNGDDLSEFANIYLRGISPGYATITLDYQRYGYYQGATFIDNLPDAYPDEDSFKVYKPYAKLTAPCRIEAENYDYGPNGFAYYDTTSGNSGGAYRPDDVDVSQMPGGGYNIGYIADGEWLTYTINIPEGYGDWYNPPTLNLRAASWKDGCQIKINDEIIDIGNTRNEWKIFQINWSIWPQDLFPIRVEFVGSGQILDYIEFVEQSPIADYETSGYGGLYPPASVTFTDKSLFFPTTWEWSFGDGTTSDAQNPSHTYTQPGRYPVSLKVTNSAGNSIKRKYIDVLYTLPLTPQKLFSVSTDAGITGPKIFKDLILYQDTNRLYVYNVNDASHTFIPTSKSPDSYCINENRVIWSSSEWDTLNGRYISNIYLFDITTEKETLITASFTASNPSISGDNIVYQDSRNGNFDIFLYNIPTKTESLICSESHDQTNPDIDGNNVVWQDYRLGHEKIIAAGSDGMGGVSYDYEPSSNIYSYSLISKTGRWISDLDTNQEEPKISGTRVVWLDDRMGRYWTDSGHYTYESDAYIFDLASNQESFVKEFYPDGDFGSRGAVDARISGDVVIWEIQYGPSFGIFNLKDNHEYSLNAGYIDVYNNNIVYQGYDNIAETDFLYFLPLSDIITPTTTTPAPGPSLIPGASGLPQDLDKDGKYEDVNGNGRTDFADVVLFFNQMSWITENEPMNAFDYNNNGRIDFADVVTLFNGLGSPTTNPTTVPMTIKTTTYPTTVGTPGTIPPIIPTITSTTSPTIPIF